MLKNNVCQFLQSKLLWWPLHGWFLILVLLKASPVQFALCILLHLICHGALSICQFYGYADSNMGRGFNKFSLVLVVIGIIIISGFFLK